jgi:transcriptional regulator with XRE-family HTH domain
MAEGKKRGERQDTIKSRSSEYQSIGEWIRAEREKSGLGQRQVARALGQNHSYMWRVEHGQQRLDLLQFLDLARVIKIDQALTIKDLFKVIDPL